MTIPSAIRPREGEQPGTPFAAFEPGAALGPLDFSIDAAVADAWAELHGADRDWYRAAGGHDGGLVPPGVLALYLVPVLYLRYPPAQGIVLTHQRFAYHRPLHAGEPLTALGRIEEKYERRGRRFVRWSAVYRAGDGALVAEATNTLMLPEAAAATEPEAARGTRAAGADHGPRVADFSGPPRLVTQATIDRYGELNGDNDIVHYDAAFARAHGFRAPIAHGLMILGYLTEALREAWGAAWLTSGTVDIRWTSPVFPGDQITPAGRVLKQAAEDGGTRLTAEVWCEDQDGGATLTGSASVLVPSGGQPPENG